MNPFTLMAWAIEDFCMRLGPELVVQWFRRSLLRVSHP